MAGPGPIISIDPTTPIGDESLKLGPLRFHEIKSSLLKLLGFGGDAVENFPTPFQAIDPTTGRATLWDDPIEAMGIATAEYADHKAVYATITSGDSVHYTGNPTPALTDAYQQGAIYILLNSGPTNASSPPLLSLNNLPVLPLRRRDGTDPLAGEIVANAFMLVVYNGSGTDGEFRFIDFIGGTVNHPVTLPADPTEPLQAATKQYVDLGQVRLPMKSVLGSNVDIPDNVATDIIVPAGGIVVPDDGSYLLHVEYAVFLKNSSDGTTFTQTWVTDGVGGLWALASLLRPTESSAFNGLCLNAAGIGPTKYAAGSTVALKLQAMTHPAASPGALTANPFGAPIGNSYLIATLLRTTT